MFLRTRGVKREYGTDVRTGRGGRCRRPVFFLRLLCFPFGRDVFPAESHRKPSQTDCLLAPLRRTNWRRFTRRPLKRARANRLRGRRRSTLISYASRKLSRREHRGEAAGLEASLRRRCLFVPRVVSATRVGEFCGMYRRAVGPLSPALRCHQRRRCLLG